MLDDPLFATFSKEALEVMKYAQEAAEHMSHAYIGSEQLLLGVIRAGGTSAMLLQEFGVTYENAFPALEHVIGRGENFDEQRLILTPRGKTIIAIANRISERHFQHTLPRHILYGILKENEGVAVRILESIITSMEGFKRRFALETGLPQLIETA